MQTLSYGFLLPETGDRGTTFFPALEDNIQQLNDHNHDGSNSAKLTSSSVTAATTTIASGSWVHQGGGTYKQTVTMPAGMLYDDYGIIMKISTTGHIIYPTIEKVTASTYDVYINDNSLTLKAFYV